MRRPRLRTGQLRQRYRVERLGAHTSRYVSGDETWAELTTFRGKLETIRSASQGEGELAGVLMAVNLVNIITHYSATLASITPNDRLIEVGSGAVLNIKNVDDPDGLRETIYITAERGRPNG